MYCKFSFSAKFNNPSRTVNCAGAPTVSVGDASATCPGICLPAENPCSGVDLVDGAAPGCPTGYVIASSSFGCAGGAACCVPLADGGYGDGGDSGDGRTDAHTSVDASADADAHSATDGAPE